MDNQEIEHIEGMEQRLIGLQKELSPSAEFSERMKKRLERHYVLMQERGQAGAETGRHGLFSFFASRVYSTVTAFVFVIFTGGLSTFAYTSEGVTNGSPLYPIKRGLESIEQAFVSSGPEATAEFHVKMLSRRLAESRVLTLQGVVDASTNEAVVVFSNSGIEAIQLVEHLDRRDRLLNHITSLLQEEERKMYSTTGLTAPVADAVIETTPVTMSVPAVRDEPIIVPRVDEQKPRAEPEKRSTHPLDATPLQTRPFSAEARIMSGELLRADRDRAPIQKNIVVPLSVPTPVIEAVEKNSRQIQKIEIRLQEMRRRR